MASDCELYPKRDMSNWWWLPTVYDLRTYGVKVDCSGRDTKETQESKVGIPGCSWVCSVRAISNYPKK